MKQDLIISGIVLILFYLIFAFVAGMFNPMAWHWVIRLFFVIAWISALIFLDKK